VIEVLILLVLNLVRRCCQYFSFLPFRVLAASLDQFPVGVILRFGKYHTFTGDQFRCGRVAGSQRHLHGLDQSSAQQLHDVAAIRWGLGVDLQALADPNQNALMIACLLKVLCPLVLKICIDRTFKRRCVTLDTSTFVL